MDVSEETNTSIVKIEESDYPLYLEDGICRFFRKTWRHVPENCKLEHEAAVECTKVQRC